MTIIGEAFVALRPEMTGFDREVESKLQKLINPGGATGLSGAVNKLGAGTAAALVTVGAVSVKLAMDMQESQARIQGAMGVTASQAKAIGDEFLNTASKSTFSGVKMAQAFAPVSGQLAQIEGHALTAKQSLAVMDAATKLADATNHDLAGNTAALAQVMQAYHIQTSGAADATNTLFNVARATGANVPEFTTAIDRLHAKLGDLSPSLGDVGALMLDLAAHGTTGSRGVMAVSGAMEHLIQAADKTGPALAKQIGSATTASETAAKRVADAQRSLDQLKERQAASASGGSVASQIALENATKKVADAQAAQAATATKLDNVQAGANLAGGTAVKTAHDLGINLFDTAGKFIGMRSVIEQLQPKLASMTQETRDAAFANLFGAGAAQQMGQVVLGGVEAWDRAASAVNKKNAVDQAAAAYSHTLKGELETMKSTASDLAAKFGEMLIPVLQHVIDTVRSVVDWLSKHKAVAEALAIIIGTVLVGSMVKWAVEGVAHMVTGLVTSVAHMLGFGATVEATAATAGPTMDALLAQIAAAVEGIAAQMGVAVDAAAAGMEATAGSTEVAAATIDTAAAESEVGFFGMAAAAVSAAASAALAFAPFLLAAAAVAAIAYVIYRNWGTIKHLFSDLINFIKDHWRGIAAILLAPFAPFLAVFLLWHKQIIGAFKDVIDWFEKLPGRILHAVEGAGKWLFNAGKDIVMGLIHGIEAMAGDLIKTIKKHLIDPVIHNPVAHWLLHSPSRLFAGYGSSLMEGLAQGIQTGAHMPTKAVANLSLAVPNLSGAAGAGPAGGQNPVVSAMGLLLLAVKENTLVVKQATLQAQQQAAAPPKPMKVDLGGTASGGLHSLASALAR